MEQPILTVQAPRTALMQLLDSLLERRFIYIHAPAGFGKTTAALLWLSHREKLWSMKRAWVSLDEHDNKATAFCRRFVVALSGLQPENNALRDLAAHQAFNTAPVDFTLHALSAFGKEQHKIVLVFDDFHILKNEEVLDLMPVLLKRLPGNFTILLLSRTAPSVSFSEMVVKEELSVVDADYLQFTGSEIKKYFGKNGRSVSAKQADEIFASTGGWAIGIRAMLISEEKSYNIDLTDRYLENFLKTHVWERWDDRCRTFMALVSVTEELTPELCEYLTEDEKSLKKTPSAEMLASLARENAFLRETGNRAYRFHDLFREFLLHNLKERGEQALKKQWNKAGDYFFKVKDYFRALPYYIKSNNADGIARTLFEMYDYHAAYASIKDTLEAIHASVNETLVEKHPFLLETQAWAAYVEGRADDFETILNRYYKLAPKIILKNPRTTLNLVLLRGCDYRESLIQTTKTIHLLPFKGSVKAPTPSISQNMPFFHRSFRDFSEYVFETEKNIRLLEKTMGIIIGAEFETMKHCIYAGIHYEKGNLDEAREHALAAGVNIPDDCSPEIRFCAMMILTNVLLVDGQKTEANRILDNVRDMIENQKAFYLNPNLDAYFVRLKLADGDIGAAGEWLKNHSASAYDKIMFFKIYQHFTTARAYIATGNYTTAALFLKKLLELSQRYNRTLDVIEAQILLAIAYWKKGGQGQKIALAFLDKAILAAHEYGYTQLFANEGAGLVNMLARLQKRTVQSNYSGEKLPAGFVKTLYFAAVAESKRTKGLTGGRPPENLAFTDKQIMVMRLLCEGLGRNEIAEKMGLKPNGVKSHTTLIYKKLDVSGALEAVMKIKELGLLDRKGE